jgi:hypothetical protein
MLPVVVGVAVAFSSLEYGGLLYDYVEPLYRYDDMTPMIDEIGLATVFVIGGLVFGVCAWALVLLEGLRQPKLTDHLRHCAYLYIFFILLSAVLIPDYIEGLRLGYPGVETPAQVVWLVAALAILIDALVLTWHRWRFARIEHGATA